MPLLINREVVADNWTLVDEESLNQTGDIIVPLALYLENKEALNSHEGLVGLQVNGDDDITAVLENVEQFPLIAVDFPVLRDGRGFSIARLLNRANYQGEIRATGDVGRDRIAYMERCGFTAIQIADDIYKDEMLSAFTEMSNYYQGAADSIKPVYKQN